VRVAPLDDGSVEVLEGLNAGDTVIAPLPPRLRDGAPITTQGAAEPEAPPTEEGAAVGAAEAAAGDAT
jgi:hypothetical protein